MPKKNWILKVLNRACRVCSGVSGQHLPYDQRGPNGKNYYSHGYPEEQDRKQSVKKHLVLQGPRDAMNYHVVRHR